MAVRSGVRIVDLLEGCCGSRETAKMMMIGCQLKKVPPIELSIAPILISLDLRNNHIEVLPVALSALKSVQFIYAGNNRLVRIAAEIGRLPKLEVLNVTDNPRLGWLPSSFYASGRILGCHCVGSADLTVYTTSDMSLQSGDLADVTHLQTFADEFAGAAIGLQDLELPALVTLEILDALQPNAVKPVPGFTKVRMAAKWDLVVAVKHFRDRRRS